MTKPTSAQKQGGPTTPGPTVAGARPTESQIRGRVVRLDGWDDYRNRRTVTWRTYLDGKLLGNAYSEDEGWRWIEDMLKLEARDG